MYATAVFRYPTGIDEEKIATATRDNASVGKNALMARCLTALGDMPDAHREALGTAIFNDLTLSDRKLVDNALNDEAPGVSMSRDVRCDACGREFTTSLDMSDFFGSL